MPAPRSAFYGVVVSVEHEAGVYGGHVLHGHATSVPVMVGLPARPGNMAWFRLPSE